MSRVYLKLKRNKWCEVDKSDFWIDRMLYIKLLGLKSIQRKNWDGVIVVDGKERSGKSVLGMIMAWFLSNGTLTIKNFARGLSDAAKKISELPDKSVLIVDEASLMFSSKDSMGKEQKNLIKLMDVVGQKNMIFILCLPCFFDLNKTIAVRRSLFLCHVYPDAEYNRGQYAFWGERKKKFLYIYGKRSYDSYSKPNADFVGPYDNFIPPFYQEYLNIVKKESLEEVMKGAIGDSINHDQRLRECEAKCIALISKHTDLSQYEIGLGMELSQSTIRDRLKLHKELDEATSSRKSSVEK